MKLREILIPKLCLSSGTEKVEHTLIDISFSTWNIYAGGGDKPHKLQRPFTGEGTQHRAVLHWHTEGSQAAAASVHAWGRHRAFILTGNMLHPMYFLCSLPGLCRPVTERPWRSTFNLDGSSSSLSPLQKRKEIPELQKMAKADGIQVKNRSYLPNKSAWALTRKVATVGGGWALWTAPSLMRPFDR